MGLPGLHDSSDDTSADALNACPVDFSSRCRGAADQGFSDMIALKGRSDIGDKVNTQIIQPLIEANARLGRSDFPDFNDPNKLGEGSAMVERLSNLVGIFQKPELDFSGNRAENDDILGDAYEYLMRHFATESGKSKGQFYTPSEVSRVIAQVIGIGPHNSKASTTAYDPTCGSGSLLLKLAAQAGTHITLEGQEMDVTTAGLARMNMILHDFPTASILSGNTLADPKFKVGQQLLKQWLHLTAASTALKKHVRGTDSVLDALVFAHYPKLTEAEIKTLALDDTWMARLSSAVQGELDRVSQTLTGRTRELAERYSTPLPKLADEVTTLTQKVEAHLAAMGAV